jgi:hypothetical protein
MAFCGAIIVCMMILPAASADFSIDNAVYQISTGGGFSAGTSPASVSQVTQGNAPLLTPGTDTSALLFSQYPNILAGNPIPAQTLKSPSITGNSAQGSISAWTNSHLMQGNSDGSVSDIQYSQKVTASGSITNFVFSTSYLSGNR